MKIVFGSDEKTPLTDCILQWLKETKHEVKEVGHLIDKNKQWRWVEIGREVGKAVTSGEADYGIVCCWSGTGVCMAANKNVGTRAALCWGA